MFSAKRIGGAILILLGLALIIYGLNRYFNPLPTPEQRWAFFNPVVALPMVLGVLAVVYGYILNKTLK